MNNQNNMLNFITLHDVAGDAIELNPAHIVYMIRTDTSKLPVSTAHNFLDIDEDNIINEDHIMPYTLINMAHTTMALGVTETPEEIANLQMEASLTLMKTVSKHTAVLMKIISDELEEEYGDY
jgi:hypothetical protein